ncbi:hypothetical protein GQ43DRAFT_400644 [Delitschia confertaspora ATCC 74209]|uniref:Histidine kinase n=1 Tax=Delitschia confertaspora ATCC 74209 TaxID=1513339 RepID=A0A9P4MSZ5_9PLEO|nr:hypothetical protein GQ43DRAFT_400644 [Delitschia confertaspora ATCC 74209]
MSSSRAAGVASAPPLTAPAAISSENMVTDRTKEREFYRYFNQSQRPHPDAPQSQRTTPVPTPLDGSATSFSPPLASEQNPPHPSHDKALTAFAQLGALRLNCRRSLISFFDRKSCYILAEATRTLSLKTGHAQFENDDLCFGTMVFPKEKSICYYTVNLPPKYQNPLAGDYTDVTSLVVDDLAADERFKKYPFVEGAPFSRFYAGVPIRSPSGHSIGTYCVLDENPRPGGISTTELAFLKDMAITVMRHLEMTRATDDHRRGGIMVRSLGCFAEGKSSLEDWWEDPWEAPTRPSVTTIVSESVSQPRHRRSTVSSQPGAYMSAEDRVESWGSSNPSSEPSAKSSVPATSPDSGFSGISATTPQCDHHTVAAAHVPTTEAVPASSTTPETSLQEKLLAPDVKTTFGRAATIMLEATEADGAVFFDASIGTFGGLVDEELPQEHPDLSKQNKPCMVLGAALAKPAGESRPTSPGAPYIMTEGVLRHLLRAYPRGQIFNFDDEPDLTQNECEQNQQIDPVRQVSFPELFPRKTESAYSQDDELLLRDIFPKARSVVLYPLWDGHRDRWFAGAVIWSSDPMRVFTSDQELSYLTAFGNSVMAEVARLDTKLADNAKADFISSISHELRSPLHGILGSCELLKDTNIDTFQMSMTQTIETCGKTLLDTINHVLDFAKINNLASGSKYQKHRSFNQKRIIAPERSQGNDIMTLITDVDLGSLTEEVLETVFAGYNFQKNAAAAFGKSTPSANAESNLAIIIDIDQSINYVFRTQPGAWRRILMNVFGNALKYTETGYIKVKLSVKACPPSLENTSEVRLTILDSGIGISDEYMRTRLWHSFAQEDPLSQGTGLGLSIVKQIVHSLGGSIDVQSKKGVGTRVTVSCRLQHSMPSPGVSASLTDTDFPSIKKRTKGKKVVFVGFEQQAGDYFPGKGPKFKEATEQTLKALEHTCNDWFGLTVVHPKDPTSTDADLFIASEAGAELLRAHFSSNAAASSTTPVIVVCQGAASACSTTTMTVPGHVFECIPQPCGPHKLGKALTACLNRRENLKTTEEELVAPVASLTLKDLKENMPILKAKPSSDSLRPFLSPSMSTPSLSSQAEKPQHTPLSILAVDDNPINLRLLRTFIDKLKHNHHLATNGLEAVNLFKDKSSPPSGDTSDSTSSLAAHPFDVVLMDINMPTMDGLEATRQIRAYEREIGARPATIIALTGVASAQAQNEAFTSGINLFLIKPVRLSELEVVLRGVVTGKNEQEIGEVVVETESDVLEMGGGMRERADTVG